MGCVPATGKAKEKSKSPNKPVPQKEAPIEKENIAKAPEAAPPSPTSPAKRVNALEKIFRLFMCSRYISISIEL